MFEHSVKVPQSYKLAGKILQQVKEESANLKSLLYQEKNKHFPIQCIHALIFETLKHESQLNDLIVKSGLLENVSRVDPWLARILITDLLWGKKKLPGQSKPVKTILQYHDTFLKLLESENIVGNVDSKKDIISPRYIRINTLRLTAADAVRYFQDEGWNLVRCTSKSYNDFLNQVENLGQYDFMPDYHVKVVFVFAPNTQFHDCPLYQNGEIFLQDKATCLAGYLLAPTPGSTILDMCAAPGMKTTHLAAIMKNEGTIYSVEQDEGRYKTLCEFVESSGATCVKPIYGDAAKMNKINCPNVDYVLLDPSCSGSGIKRITNNDKTQDLESGRVHKLAGFQAKLLRHALNEFRTAKRVVYSTCSLYPEENEAVIWDVIKNYKGKFQLVSVKEKLNNNWNNIGDLNYINIGDKCLYTRPENDHTSGFFVAIFENFSNSEITVKNSSQCIQSNSSQDDNQNDKSILTSTLNNENIPDEKNSNKKIKITSEIHKELESVEEHPSTNYQTNKIKKETKINNLLNHEELHSLNESHPNIEVCSKGNSSKIKNKKSRKAETTRDHCDETSEEIKFSIKKKKSSEVVLNQDIHNDNSKIHQNGKLKNDNLQSAAEEKLSIKTNEKKCNDTETIENIGKKKKTLKNNAITIESEKTSTNYQTNKIGKETEIEKKLNHELHSLNESHSNIEVCSEGNTCKIKKKKSMQAETTRDGCDETSEEIKFSIKKKKSLKIVLNQDIHNDNSKIHQNGKQNNDNLLQSAAEEKLSIKKNEKKCNDTETIENIGKKKKTLKNNAITIESEKTSTNYQKKKIGKETKIEKKLNHELHSLYESHPNIEVCSKGNTCKIKKKKSMQAETTRDGCDETSEEIKFSIKKKKSSEVVLNLDINNDNSKIHQNSKLENDNLQSAVEEKLSKKKNKKNYTHTNEAIENTGKEKKTMKHNAIIFDSEKTSENENTMNIVKNKKRKKHVDEANITVNVLSDETDKNVKVSKKKKRCKLRSECNDQSNSDLIEAGENIIMDMNDNNTKTKKKIHEIELNLEISTDDDLIITAVNLPDNNHIKKSKSILTSTPNVKEDSNNEILKGKKKKISAFINELNPIEIDDEASVPEVKNKKNKKKNSLDITESDDNDSKKSQNTEKFGLKKTKKNINISNVSEEIVVIKDKKNPLLTDDCVEVVDLGNDFFTKKRKRKHNFENTESNKDVQSNYLDSSNVEHKKSKKKENVIYVEGE